MRIDVLIMVSLRQWQESNRKKGGESMAHIPYGYRIVGGKAEIDPEAKERLDIFFDEYLSGASISKAAKEAGIPHQHSVMAALMRNPVYLGTDYYPPMTDQERFNEVEDEMAERSKNHRPRTTSIHARPVMTRFSMAVQGLDFGLMSAADEAASMYNLIVATG